MAEVSVSTVSHALSGSRYVKPETKERTFKIVKKLNYRSSSIASGLRKKSLKTIAVIVPNISS